MIMLNNVLRCIVILLCFVSITFAEKIYTPGIYSKKNSVNVTIWVHGTHPINRLLSCRVSPMRKQMYVPHGISLAKDLPDRYFFNSIAVQCDKHDSEHYPLDHFYLFGWKSEKMTPKQRKKSGQQLYKEINDLLKKYRKSYEHVNVCLIGFSHGGNVILHMMNCLPFTLSHIETKVVLLGTPIQESTRLYVNNPNVSKVYSFYSESDWIQRIDVQKFHCDAPRHVPFWSKRKFADTDRVIQVQLKVNGKGIGHLKYRNIMTFIPDLIEQTNKIIKKNCSKDHISLNFIPY